LFLSLLRLALPTVQEKMAWGQERAHGLNEAANLVVYLWNISPNSGVHEN
jgi:hypothetical protein